MGQSLVRNYLHIVTSTKNRRPFIHPPIESELHAYIGAICNRLECWVYTDLVHILCHLSKNITLIKLMEELKSHSSFWIKSKGLAYKNFYCQDGYVAFSVNPLRCRSCKRIYNQSACSSRQESFWTRVYRDTWKVPSRIRRKVCVGLTCHMHLGR